MIDLMQIKLIFTDIRILGPTKPTFTASNKLITNSNIDNFCLFLKIYSNQINQVLITN